MTVATPLAGHRVRRLHSPAWDHPLVGPNVLLEHHLPGIRTLDLEILGRVSLELSFDLWREIGNPAQAAFLPYLPMWQATGMQQECDAGREESPAVGRSRFTNQGGLIIVGQRTSEDVVLKRG